LRRAQRTARVTYAKTGIAPARLVPVMLFRRPL